MYHVPNAATTPRLVPAHRPTGATAVLEPITTVSMRNYRKQVSATHSFPVRLKTNAIAPLEKRTRKASRRHHATPIAASVPANAIANAPRRIVAIKKPYTVKRIINLKMISWPSITNFSPWVEVARTVAQSRPTKLLV